ncbi:MAG TPA: hypothetical protein VEI02_14805 [Planctomycetota bacterium]|nr:hypothetical protein [Planctomycetota bacterium]
MTARVLMATLIASVSVIAQAPINDEPSGAITIVDGYNGLFSNAGATNSAGYTATCGSGANADVFFSYTALQSGPHAFATCTPYDVNAGTLVDTIVNVYDASAPAASLVCNDDGCISQGLGSFATLSLTAGTTYLVRVSRYGTNTDGTFHLTVYAPNAVGGDTCAAATTLTLGHTSATMAGATASNPSPTCGSFSTTNPDVWFSFTAPLTGPLLIHRENDAISRIAVYTGSCGAETLETGTNTCINSTSATGQETIINAVAGVTYLIRIGTTSASTAVFGLNLDYKFTFSIIPNPAASTITIVDQFGAPNELVFNAITLVQGSFPNGWWFGVDIPFAELLAEMNAGPPFLAILDANGNFSYTIINVPQPLGITVYGVAVTFFPSGFLHLVSDPIAVNI